MLKTLNILGINTTKIRRILNNTKNTKQVQKIQHKYQYTKKY